MIDIKAPPGTLEAIELMYFAYRAFTEPPDRLLAERGLGRVHHRILYFVGRRAGLSVGELVDTLRVTKQALNAPLRQLMEMGLVNAEVAAHDRRVRRLSLSTEGQRLERRLTATQARQLSKVFDAAGEPATEAWRAVMRGLAAGRAGATA
jgi:DNA-binding MarR family transcriptional regulator